MSSEAPKGGISTPEPQAPPPRTDNQPSAAHYPQSHYYGAPPPYGYPQAYAPRAGQRSHVAGWIIGGVLGALVIGGLLVTMVALLIGGFFVSALNQNEQTSTVTRTLSVSGTPSLTFSDSAGAVTVRTGSDNQVTLQITKHAWGNSVSSAQSGLAATSVDVRQNGDAITVQTQFNGSTFGVNRRSVDLQVTVPAQANVDIHVGAGNIDVRQMVGTIRLDTGAGNVTIANATFRGDSRLNTGAGNIDVTAAIASGAAVDVHVGAGNVTITLPADTPARLDASTGVGNLTISGWQMSTTSTGVTGHHASGDMNTSPTAKLTVQVGTGNVTLISR